MQRVLWGLAIPVASELCSRGKRHERVCCAITCQECTGPNCVGDCCGWAISDSGRLCENEEDVSCLLPTMAVTDNIPEPSSPDVTSLCNAFLGDYRAYLPARLSWLEPLLPANHWSETGGNFLKLEGRLSESFNSFKLLLSRMEASIYFHFGVTVESLVHGPFKLSSNEPCLATFGISVSYLRGAHGQEQEYAQQLLSMNWLALLGSGWPIFQWLQDLMLDRFRQSSAPDESTDEQHHSILELHPVFEVGEQPGLLASGVRVESKADVSVFAKGHAAKCLEMSTTVKELASCVQNTTIASPITGDTIGNALSLLSALERNLDRGHVNCWEGSRSRSLCCGLAMDGCCGHPRMSHRDQRLPEEVPTCWDGGLTHERCCKDLQADDCLHHFYELLQSNLTCDSYRHQYARSLYPCLVWTMPDYHFASTFAWPLMTQGQGRCFEVEVSMPAAVTNAYAGISSFANSSIQCDFAGCPSARFGVCTPLSCSSEDVRVAWQDFLNPYGDEERESWCQWRDAQVFEYYTSQELLKPWRSPVKYLHLERTSGSTLKSVLHSLQKQAANQQRSANKGGSALATWSSNALLCMPGSQLFCPTKSTVKYMFNVRNPLSRFVSLFYHRLEFHIAGYAQGTFKFRQAPSFFKALGKPQNASFAWRFIFQHNILRLSDDLGGLLNLHRCLQQGRISFVARSEDIYTDALAMHDLFFGGHQKTGDVDLHINRRDQVRRSIRAMSLEALQSLRHYLFEDYLVIALCLWYRLLPPDYANEAGLSTSRITAGLKGWKHIGDQHEEDCLAAGGLWLARLVGFSSPWWLIWYDGKRCHVSAAVTQDVGHALMQGVLRKTALQAQMTDANGTVVESFEDQTSATDCTDHLQYVGKLLCNLQRQTALGGYTELAADVKMARDRASRILAQATTT